MQDGFDPYHKWLGIPPQDQPPHHYRLLAISLFESDPEVIEGAADQRMGHVRTFQRGLHSTLSQRILNELAAARVCLLSAEKKQAYDTDLRSRLTPAPPLPPPQQPPMPTVLSAPPPPVGQSPALPTMPSQAACEIAPPPAGSMLSQRSPLFPPLDATLPDPEPPSRMATRNGLTRRLSIISGVFGIALLLLAAIVFWVLYSRETGQDVVSDANMHDSPARRTAESIAPTHGFSDRVTTSEEPVSEAAGEREPVDAAGEMPEEVETNDKGVNRADLPIEMLPAEKEADLPAVAEVAESESGTAPPALPSPADASKQASEVADDSPNTAGEPEDSPADGETDKRTQPPKLLTRNRTARSLWAFRQADSAALLAEAQKPERHLTDVYVLLKFAFDKAVATQDADAALQAVDILESKFVGDYDQDRVRALNTILAQMSRQGDRRAIRDLAMISLQASRDALEAENEPLAKSLGTIAMEAARSSGNAAFEKQVENYLSGL